MTDYDFDEAIDRRAVPALKHHPMVLGADGKTLFPAGVTDMDLRVAPHGKPQFGDVVQKSVFRNSRIESQQML